MKKTISLLMSAIIFCGLFCGCGSKQPSTKSEVEESEKTEQVGKNENSTKTLSDYLPTVDEFIQKLKDEKTIDDTMPVEEVEDLKGQKYCAISVYSNDAKKSSYNILLYYTNDKKLYKVTMSLFNYTLSDAKPLHSFIEKLPNSLYGEADILAFVKENGKTNISGDGENVSYTDMGITYNYSSTIGKSYKWVEFYVYVNTEFEVE